jgi:hypothetical protein
MKNISASGVGHFFCLYTNLKGTPLMPVAEYTLSYLPFDENEKFTELMLSESVRVFSPPFLS